MVTQNSCFGERRKILGVMNVMVQGMSQNSWWTVQRQEYHIMCEFGTSLICKHLAFTWLEILDLS